MAFKALFGDVQLIDKKGDKVDPATLSNNQAVGLYFSAHWCAPCRGFTPELAKAYNNDLKGKGMQIVFVSSDRDEHAFTEYFNEMPWLALPFSERDLKGKLSSKFKVRGIPTLVILDSNGKLITADGREAVSEDPKGENFPWAPKSFKEALGTKFVNNKGAVVTADELKDKVLGIYFSAHWCPPCRAFTPELVKTYNALKAAGKPFEIIFASSDQDEHAFKEYHNEMPWLAVPYEDRTRKNDLSKLYGVEGIPTFVLVNSDGQLITKNGRGAVSADPQGNDFPWSPKLVNELIPTHASELNDTPSVIVFADGNDAKSATEALTAAATKIVSESKGKEDGGEVIFFVAKTHDLVARVKKLMGVNQDTSVLAILDIPQEGAFFSDVKTLGDVTAEAVEHFVADYRAGKIAKTPFKH